MAASGLPTSWAMPAAKQSEGSLLFLLHHQRLRLLQFAGPLDDAFFELSLVALELIVEFRQLPSGRFQQVHQRGAAHVTQPMKTSIRNNVVI